MFDIKWLVSVFYIHVKYIPKIYSMLQRHTPLGKHEAKFLFSVSPGHPSSSLTCRQPIFRLPKHILRVWFMRCIHWGRAKLNNTFSFLPVCVCVCANLILCQETAVFT